MNPNSMAKKKQKSSVQFVLDYLELQQTMAEMMGIRIVSDTLKNILESVGEKAQELYALEIENATLLGRQEILEELNNEQSIDKQI